MNDAAGPFDIGDVVRLSLALTVSGVATDPSVVSLVVLAPTGTSTTYTIPPIVRDSTGAYHYDLAVSAAGQWFYRWTSTGTAAASEESSFLVRSRAVA